MKRSFSILILLVFTLSSVRVTLATHYCGGEMVDWKISMGGEKASCGMEKGMPGCEGESKFGRNCCKDKVSQLFVDAAYSSSVNKLDAEKIIEFSWDQLSHKSSISIEKISFLNHYPKGNSPPKMRVANPLALLQVFRI